MADSPLSPDGTELRRSVVSSHRVGGRVTSYKRRSNGKSSSASTPPEPASSYAHRFPLSCMASSSSWRERRTRWRLVSGYRHSHRGKDNAPLIRSISHAPDQTANGLNVRPRRSTPLGCYLEMIFMWIRGRRPQVTANTSPCRLCRGLTPPSECAPPGAPKRRDGRYDCRLPKARNRPGSELHAKLQLC